MQNAVGRSTKPAAYPIDSVDNALRLLTLLRNRTDVPAVIAGDGASAPGFELGPGLGVVEVARQLGIAPSTAHRLLAMLVHHGFAVQDLKRKYHLGPAFSVTPASARSGRDLRAVMRPSLVSLSRQLEETVHLMALQGSAVRFVDGIEADHADRVGTREGMVLPAHNTAGGRALLAQLTKAELESLYSHGLPVVYGPAVSELPELVTKLNAVRRRGYAINDEESERNIVSVAAVLKDADGVVRGALAVAVRPSRCPNSLIPKIGKALMAEAARMAPDLCDIA
ncbi:IclR family transcriptional regulator [Microbispora bryophytorum]|uniref:IclR family transcriptional regulator n=1 Tax=Microbispora bryophytorum subsp. camponoti TaxID=1677852 RepID=A0ABR8L9C8_9ACTN|nr:IclR family transcriptional regulator [Microbispora camponoti]MBD3146592.1 IclR family transcriptional regulator [Microbispora camponoti]